MQPSDEEAEIEAEEPVTEASDDLEWLTSEEISAEAGEESEPIAAEETPDWLAELQPVNDDEEEAVAEPVAEAGDDFEWLTSEETPAEADEESEPIAAEETPDWLAELQPSDEEAEIEAEEPMASAGDELEWLTSEETSAEDAEPVAEAAGDMPGWLAEDEDQPDAEEETAEPVASAIDDQAEMDENEETLVEPAPTEALESSPANNAPDWLNAMVPGLDVDYEATEDEVSEDFEEEPEPETAKREFAWLIELVDEETAAVDQPAFVFSRPPVWMEPAALADQTDVDHDFPDWPSDDSDANVPE